MESVVQSLLAGFPILITHFLTTLLVFIAASLIYILITPHQEFKLIKDGNKSAALSIGGALLGLSIPLAVCLAGSVNTYDIVIWGSVTLGIQLTVYFIIDLLVRGISVSIQNDNLAPTIFLVSAKLSIALLNAAAIAG